MWTAPRRRRVPGWISSPPIMVRPAWAFCPDPSQAGLTGWVADAREASAAAGARMLAGPAPPHLLCWTPPHLPHPRSHRARHGTACLPWLAMARARAREPTSKDPSPGTHQKMRTPSPLKESPSRVIPALGRVSSFCPIIVRHRNTRHPSTRNTIHVSALHRTRKSSHQPSIASALAPPHDKIREVLTVKCTPRLPPHINSHRAVTLVAGTGGGELAVGVYGLCVRGGGAGWEVEGEREGEREGYEDDDEGGYGDESGRVGGGGAGCGARAAAAVLRADSCQAAIRAPPGTPLPRRRGSDHAAGACGGGRVGARCGAGRPPGHHR